MALQEVVAAGGAATARHVIASPPFHPCAVPGLPNQALQRCSSSGGPSGPRWQLNCGPAVQCLVGGAPWGDGAASRTVPLFSLSGGLSREPLEKGFCGRCHSGSQTADVGTEHDGACNAYQMQPQRQSRHHITAPQRCAF